MSKNLEIEFRSLLTESRYHELKSFLSTNGKDLGADDKRVWFFVMPDKLLKVTHDISKQNGKVTLKLTKIGYGSSFEEIEYPLAEQDIGKAVKLFESLGHEYLLEPTILRHNYEYKGVEFAVKYSKSWGYHLEMEVMITESSEQSLAEEKIYSVAKELDLHIMTDEELQDFTENIETNYVHPPEAAE